MYCELLTIHHTQVEELRGQPLDFILKKED